jgi:NAD(P)-dependent dehydrogenase (short-subunit alcohol dehydrogenase family)
MKLKNKVALITGGTSGIGLETAKLFQNEGARVVVSGVDPARLQEASRQLGPDVLVRRADLRVRTDIDELIATIREKFRHLDVLFANAGIGIAAPLEAVTEDQVDEQFSINFKGMFFTVQKAAPILGSGSSIVLTTSFLDAVGTPGLSVLSERRRPYARWYAPSAQNSPRAAFASTR